MAAAKMDDAPLKCIEVGRKWKTVMTERERKRVLIFPAGAENALEIYDALRYRVDIELFGASGKKDFAAYQYDAAHYIEDDFYIQHAGFLERFNALLRTYRIDVVIPTHDDIALFLAQHREAVAAKVLVSDARTAEVCRHKRQMFSVLADAGCCPRWYRTREEVSEGDFPLFRKPDVSAGAVGAQRVDTPDELTDAMFSEEYVLCEYLPGQELTVDCFTDRQGQLKFIGPRSRDRIQMGIAFRSTAVPLTEEVRSIAEAINAHLSFLGAWYFQLRQDAQGRYKLLEISCCQSGTMTLYRHLGVNFPYLGILELYGQSGSSLVLTASCQLERRLHTAFRLDVAYDHVYLDYDDTLIVEGRICASVIRFVYQCHDDGIPVTLLTRHEGDLRQDMDAYALSPRLFDRVLCLAADDAKAAHVTSGSIFVDNSFAERQAVQQQCGVPVFDVDAVDMLLRE